MNYLIVCVGNNARESGACATFVVLVLGRRGASASARVSVTPGALSPGYVRGLGSTGTQRPPSGVAALPHPWVNARLCLTPRVILRLTQVVTLTESDKEIYYYIFSV